MCDAEAFSFGPLLKRHRGSRNRGGHPGLGCRRDDAGAERADGMLELLDYLRANGFKTYIVSGGGIEFMRPWTEAVYGIPPEQVVGSSLVAQYDVVDGTPVLARSKQLSFLDDNEGKPVAIQQHIGRRPIAAFGNSDGDLQMMEWTRAGPSASLTMIVHHDDADREFAYDRESASGRAVRVLDEAGERGLDIVSMRHDWKRIYPFEASDNV